jgi:NAD-dependent SIR2 family protein deacetylase
MGQQKISDWRCSNGHKLGVVVRNSSRIRQLWVYRQAIDDTVEEPAEVDVLGIAEGTLFDVRCSICGSNRTWVPGDEAIKRIIERYGQRVTADGG